MRVAGIPAELPPADPASVLLERVAAYALFCASTAGGLAGVLHKARCASGPMNAVQALTGALAGARFGAASIPSRLLNSVPLAAHARVLRAAAALLEQRDGTLTSVTS